MRRAFFPLLLALFSCVVCRLSAADRPVLPLGSPLPDFKLPGIDGHDYTPADFASAKVLAVVFTCNHCPTAQLYEERLKRLVAEFKPRGVAFLAINPNHAKAVRLDELAWSDLDDTLEEMKLRAAHKEFNFPYADDGPTQAVTEKFGAIATPHVFLFDGDRHLRFQGRIDDSEREDQVKRQDAREAIEALLAAREPAVTQTKVFGCSIKWREKAGDNKRWRASMDQKPVTLEPADAAALRDLRANAGTGKLRLINVWGTFCPPCIAEFDELMDHALRFGLRNLEVVTLAAHVPADGPKVLAFLQEHHATTRNLIYGTADRDALAEAFDPDWNGALPYTLLIGTDGKVLYRETGSIDFLALRRAILPALDAIKPWPAKGGK